MDLVKENIKNLTTLWKVAGQKAGKYLHNDQFDLSLDCNSDWPNRLWFQNGVEFKTIERAIDLMGMHLAKLTIPIWGANLSNSANSLEELGFTYKFSQVGMSIQLDQNFRDSSNVKIQRVTGESDAALWSELFKKSFGYRISTAAIIKTKDLISYYIGFHGKNAVGTSALYLHRPSIAGIHSMGIIPEMRRRGFAEEILKQQLNLAKAQGAKYAVLQASDMGKGLYLKLGFREQFTMKNYVKS